MKQPETTAIRMGTIMSDIKLPGIGNVPKPALIIAGAASLGIIVYAYWRHGSSSTDTSTTDTSSTLDSSIDPATGVPYADEYGYMNSGYSFQGVTDPSTGAIIGNGVGTGTVTTVSTNAAWAQAAQAYLAGIVGYDGTTVAAALGAGLLGHYMTPDQVGIWNEAIAYEGNPPQGYPPLNQTPPIGNPSPTPSKLHAPSAVHAQSIDKSHIEVFWNTISGAQGYHIKIQGPGADHTVITHNTGHYTFGSLSHNSTYHFAVAGYNAAGTGAYSGRVSGRTKK